MWPGCCIWNSDIDPIIYTSSLSYQPSSQQPSAHHQSYTPAPSSQSSQPHSSNSCSDRCDRAYIVRDAKSSTASKAITICFTAEVNERLQHTVQSSSSLDPTETDLTESERHNHQVLKLPRHSSSSFYQGVLNSSNEPFESLDSIERVMVHKQCGEMSEAPSPSLEHCQSVSRDNMVSLGQYQSITPLNQNKQDKYIISHPYIEQKSSRHNQRQSFENSIYHSPKDRTQIVEDPKRYKTVNKLYQCDPLSYEDSLNLESGPIEDCPNQFNNLQYFEQYNTNENTFLRPTHNEGSAGGFHGCTYQTSFKTSPTEEVKRYHHTFVATPHPCITAKNAYSLHGSNGLNQDSVLSSVPQRFSVPVECVDLASEELVDESIQRTPTVPLENIENVDKTDMNTAFAFSPHTSGESVVLSRRENEPDSKNLEWDLHSTEGGWNANQNHIKKDTSSNSSRWSSQYSSSGVNCAPRTPGWNISTSSLNLLPRTPGWNFSTSDIDLSTRCDHYRDSDSYDSHDTSNARSSPIWFQVPHTPKVVTQERVETANFDQFDFPPATPGGSDSEIRTSDQLYLQPPENRNNFECETIAESECVILSPRYISNRKQKNLTTLSTGASKTQQSENKEENVEHVPYKSPVWNIPPPTPGVDNDDVLDVSPISPATVDLTSTPSSLKANIPSHSICGADFTPEVINLFSTNSSQTLDISPTSLLSAKEQPISQSHSLEREINVCPPIVSFGAMDNLPFISRQVDNNSKDLTTPPQIVNNVVDDTRNIKNYEINDRAVIFETHGQNQRRGSKRNSNCALKTSKTQWDTSLVLPTSGCVSENRNTEASDINGGKTSEQSRKLNIRKIIPSDDEVGDETWGMSKKRKAIGRKQKRKREYEVKGGSPNRKTQKRKPRCTIKKKSVDKDFEVLEMRDEYNDEDDQDYFDCCGTTNYDLEGNIRNSPNEKLCANEDERVNNRGKDIECSSVKISHVVDEQKGEIQVQMPYSEMSNNIHCHENQNRPARDFLIDQMPIEISCGSQTLTLDPEGKRGDSIAERSDNEKITKDETISNEDSIKLQNKLLQQSHHFPDRIFSEDTILHATIYSQETIVRNSYARDTQDLNPGETTCESSNRETTSNDSRSGVLQYRQENCNNLASSSCNTSTEACNNNDLKNTICIRKTQDTTEEYAISSSVEKLSKVRLLEKKKDKERHSKEVCLETETDNELQGEVTGEEENALAEEDSPHEAARMRRRQLAAAFIMQEAEEGDAAEDDDDDWLDDGDGDEASEAAAAASAAEARRRRQRTESWRPLRPPSPSVSDILKRLRLGTSEDGGSIAKARNAVPREEPDQQALLPGVSDPCLWMVQCCRSQERQSVLALMRKALRCIAGKSSEQLRIHSVVYSGSAPRYVYIEALRKQHAEAAIHDVASLRAGRYRAKQVPVSEMPDVLKACRKIPLMRRGQWVRPKRGIYRDDVAQVVEVDPAEEYAVVRLLPRIDYSLLAPGGGLKPIAERTGPKRRRTPARRLDVDALRRAGVDVSAAAVTGEVLFNRDTYKDGFLVKKFPLKALTSARPTLEEAQTFGVDPEAGLLLSEHPEPWLGPGDDVEVKEGGLEGLRGKVLEVHCDTVTVKVDDERIQEPVICAASELTKDFKEGDKVRVVTGAHRGATGLVVKAANGKVFISEDETNREIEALVRHVRLAMNSAPAEPAGGLRWADMVTLRDGSVGMVERVEGTSVRVLDAQGRLRAVDARTALLRGPHTRCRPLLDCEQNEIHSRDAVEVVEGPHKGSRGTVKGAYRGCAFIAGDSTSDARLFVARATHLRLQGGASDRCRMFLRQLDPDAAAEAAISVGVRGATQPASPAPPDPRRRAVTVSAPHTPQNVAITALGPPPPPPPLPSDARRADFDTFDRGLRRDRTLLGAVVIVTAGAYKGSVGTVRDASLASARVELYTPQQTIPVKREHLKVIEAPSSATPQRRPRVVTGPAPSPTRQAQFSLGGFYGTSDNSTPRIPSSPRPLPAPGINESPTSIPAGYRTPMWGVAATPMYDAGSRTPLPTPQSPAASAAVWEARTTPGSMDSNSPLSHGYMSLPLVYPPVSAPAAPPAPLPLTWPIPGLEVTVSTAPGLAETATVRAVTRDGGVTMMMRSGTLVTLATSERVRPSPPAKGETCVVVGEGPLRARRVLLANIDGADGVIRLENCMTMQLIPMAHLCRLAEDEESPFHSVETPVS